MRNQKKNCHVQHLENLTKLGKNSLVKLLPFAENSNLNFKNVSKKMQFKNTQKKNCMVNPRIHPGIQFNTFLLVFFAPNTQGDPIILGTRICVNQPVMFIAYWHRPRIWFELKWSQLHWFIGMSPLKKKRGFLIFQKKSRTLQKTLLSMFEVSKKNRNRTKT